MRRLLCAGLPAAVAACRPRGGREYTEVAFQKRNGYTVSKRKIREKGHKMAKTVGIGNQDFEKIRVDHIFYVDKTMFIKEWWESMDSVTLITRPRRFGKTLNMSMLEKFFSVSYADREICLRGFPYGEKKNTGSCREPVRSYFSPFSEKRSRCKILLKYNFRFISLCKISIGHFFSEFLADFKTTLHITVLCAIIISVMHYIGTGILSGFMAL